MATLEAFEMTVAELRARQGRKWRDYPDPVLPVWVADMDFRVAEPVRAAIQRLVDHSDYGYEQRLGEEGVPGAFAARMRERFGWEVDPAHVEVISEVIQGKTVALMAFSQPGDGVVVQSPIYPPFLSTIGGTSRRLVDNPLRDDGTRFVIDFDHLRQVADAGTRVLMLCNPHNPTGRVFERDELLALAELAIERDLIIVSDEIHQDLVYPGHQHLPIASLGPEVAARTVTLTSATKGFNLAGLRCALIHFGSAALHERFSTALPHRLLGAVNVVGVDATVAAWRAGQPWLEAVLRRLAGNRDRLTRFLAAELPEIGYRPPEGTYLAWLDFRALDLPEQPFPYLLREAKIALAGGTAFGTNGDHRARLNFATTPEVLDQVLDRLATAVRQRVR
jgi:cysteine-S-conjugate beta-lyase